MSDNPSIERFRGALRLPTVWSEGSEVSPTAAAEAEDRLGEFQTFIETAYPAFHGGTEQTKLSPYAVLYRWPGRVVSKPGEKPALFLSHYDVVPVERDHWSVDPFGAELKDDYIYGRGALDTKCTLIFALEAAEALIGSGFTPTRDVWFAFGGDEERTGRFGAKEAARWFEERGIRFAWTLDEGSVVSDRLLPGVDEPLALVGVEEKGFLDVELKVKQSPGHASRPPETQAVAILGKALHRIAKRPFPFALTKTVEEFFKSIAHLMKGPRSFVMAHPRFCAPLIYASAKKASEIAALLRTTVAMTQLQGSPADNVLPSEAKAILNLRLLPGWTMEEAVVFLRRVVRDRRVEVAAAPKVAANDPVTAVDSVAMGRGPGWAEIAAAIGASFPDATVIPFLITATTDSRHYAPLSDAVYRFAPIKLDAKELARIHGHDERISIENFHGGIAFYQNLMKTL